MTIQTQVLTVSKINRLDLQIRRDIVLYAPLSGSLDFMGIGAVAFGSANVTRNATWRDGGVRSIAQNLPRFEYSGETERGLLIKKSSTELETLTYDAANGLNSGNTLFWIQEGVLKRAPSDTNPFNGGGAWIGTDNVHIRDLLKFKRVLSNREILAVQAIVYGDVTGAPAVPVSGSWLQADFTGMDGVVDTFALPTIPVLGSLEIVHNNQFVTRTTNPSPVAGYYYYSAGTVKMGLIPLGSDSFWYRFVVP
jgi:hypothetical protein